MPESIGQQLKREREARHLSLTQVTEAIRIRPHYLEALEADDFAALPSPVQARGFLRSYADFLGLSLESLYALARQEETPPPASPVEAEATPPAGVPAPGAVEFTAATSGTQAILAEQTAPATALASPLSGEAPRSAPEIASEPPPGAEADREYPPAPPPTRPEPAARAETAPAKKTRSTPPKGSTAGKRPAAARISGGGTPSKKIAGTAAARAAIPPLGPEKKAGKPRAPVATGKAGPGKAKSASVPAAEKAPSRGAKTVPAPRSKPASGSPKTPRKATPSVQGKRPAPASNRSSSAKKPAAKSGKKTPGAPARGKTPPKTTSPAGPAEKPPPGEPDKPPIPPPTGAMPPASLPVEAAPPPPPPAEEAILQPGKAQDIFDAIGAQIRQRRELLSLDLDEVERHTHVRRRHLQALEDGRFEDLPSLVQARGMLNSYTTFLDLDTDLLLLQFADALQLRRLELQPQPPAAKQRGRRGRPPGPRKFLSADLIFAVLFIVFMAIFIVWGLALILDAQQAEAARSAAAGPTSTPDILAQATSEPSGTPTAASLPAAPDAPPVDQTTPLATAPAETGAVQIVISALGQAYLKVTADGVVLFQGRTKAGTPYPFSGEEWIEVVTGDGAALSIVYQQQDLGLLGDRGEMVDIIYTPDGILMPTPTPSPTPTITPTPTRTPRPSATPRPTP